VRGTAYELRPKPFWVSHMHPSERLYAPRVPRSLTRAQDARLFEEVWWVSAKEQQQSHCHRAFHIAKIYQSGNAPQTNSLLHPVVKKDRKSLCLVHDLQPLNAVTIWDSSLPPFVKQLAESFVGYAVYGMMDLYSGYNQHVLHKELCNLTMFGMPLGLHQLTTLPQGHTNMVQVYQGNTAFILQDEIPDYMSPFINDVPVKLVKMWYQRTDRSYETIAQNRTKASTASFGNIA